MPPTAAQPEKDAAAVRTAPAPGRTSLRAALVIRLALLAVSPVLALLDPTAAIGVLLLATPAEWI